MHVVVGVSFTTSRSTREVLHATAAASSTRALRKLVVSVVPPYPFPRKMTQDSINIADKRELEISIMPMSLIRAPSKELIGVSPTNATSPSPRVSRSISGHCARLQYTVETWTTVSRLNGTLFRARES